MGRSPWAGPPDSALVGAGPMEPGIDISDLPPEEREEARPILDRSFTGWYRVHADRTLSRVPLARILRIGGAPAGVALLELLEPGVGYVYYIAVAPQERGHQLGGALLDDALVIFRRCRATEVYAAVEEENPPSLALFGSRQFREVSRAEFSRRFGRFHAAQLRYRMTLVPGEILLRAELVGREVPPSLAST